MQMDRNQWGAIMARGSSSAAIPEGSNPVIEYEMAQRAGRCRAVKATWRDDLLHGVPIEVECYDSRGAAAGIRSLSRDEAKALMSGELTFDGDGYLVPGSAFGHVNSPSAIDTALGIGSGIGSMVFLGLLAAGGWWAYSSGMTLDGITAKAKSLFGGLTGGGSKLPVRRHRSLKRSTDESSESGGSDARFDDDDTD